MKRKEIYLTNVLQNKPRTWEDSWRPRTNEFSTTRSGTCSHLSATYPPTYLRYPPLPSPSPLLFSPSPSLVEANEQIIHDQIWDVQQLTCLCLLHETNAFYSPRILGPIEKPLPFASLD